MTAISLREKWAAMGIIFSLTPCGKDVTLEAPDRVLTKDLIAEIRKHKPKIRDWLQKQQRNEFRQELPATEETEKTKVGTEIEWHSINDLSSAEITRYRLLLEASYHNPANDAFHGDDMPQRFRERTHTFEEMETALEKFIPRMQQEGSPALENALRSPASPLPSTEASEDAKAAIADFIKVRETLPEYHAYEKMCKVLKENTQDNKIKKACALAWDAFMKACEVLPERQPFLDAKGWQYAYGSHETQRQTLPSSEVENREENTDALRELSQRIATMKQEYNLPYVWAEAFAKIIMRNKPINITNKRWALIVERANGLLNGELSHLHKMIEHGWSLEEVFACHKFVPDMRIDGMGLLMLLDQADIAEIKPTIAFLKHKDGAITTYSLGMINCSTTERSTLMEIE